MNSQTPFLPSNSDLQCPTNRTHLTHIFEIIKRHLVKSPQGITPERAHFLLKRKQLIIYARDLYTCQHCIKQKKPADLEVYHIGKYEDGQIWQLDNARLITICHGCLWKEDFRSNNEIHVIESLYYANFSSADLLGLSCLLDSDQSFVNSLKKQVGQFTLDHGIKTKHEK